MISPAAIKNTIKTEALALGFILCGVTTTNPPASFSVFENWLAQGYHGDMKYLSREDTLQKRADPRLLMMEAKTIISLAFPYPSVLPGVSEPPQIAVAAYARIPDYHHLIAQQLSRLVETVNQKLGITIQARSFTDSAPILEHDLAQRSGLGWIGRNSLLLNPKFGSCFLLAELFLDCRLEPDQPFTADYCGNCRQCIDNCPTQCINENRTINASHCLSYLTIEKKGPISEQFLSLIDNHFFGCDICQQVCPWNQKGSRLGLLQGMQEQAYPSTIQHLIDLFSMSEEQIKNQFHDTSLARSKRQGLLRNACIVLGNSQSAAALKALQQFLTVENDPVLQSTAQWAVNQLKGSARSF